MTLTGSQAQRMIDVARACAGGLEAAVPTCPGWTVTDLLVHLATVYNRVGTVLAGGLPKRPAPTELPVRPDDLDAADWLADRLGWLLAAEASVGEEAAVWTVGSDSPRAARFWFRRMVHETAIHRVDAELAAGAEVSGLAPEVAADTISELFELLRFSDTTDESGEQAQSAPSGHFFLHLHANDVEGAEWTCDTDARTVARRHAKGDVALRGTAWSLARWCWGRIPSDSGGIEAFGDLARADAWRASAVP